MALTFEKNIIPADPVKTLGVLTFVAELEARQGYENGERTGEVIERRVELSSDVQESILRVDLPPEADTKTLKFGDVVELTEAEFKAWAMIDEDSFSNYADSDVKVTAKDIKKKGGSRQNLKEARENAVPTV
ncbi:DUF961 family protein [Enterococcus sp. BWR-S5]|uniref:DUF961 family protein n=1 Tax=Enterococcus sp. BWR-S5 TaxID=2787714 RepID=UPI0019229E7F|nr:DUF961 family protein [Enterococcus sp. BWR-S5]MBL1226496.1 DUF961 family protein [Enterococcus sp. BWR-S5]